MKNIMKSTLASTLGILGSLGILASSQSFAQEGAQQAGMEGAQKAMKCGCSKAKSKSCSCNQDGKKCECHHK
jgi:hypothetical protein